MPLGVMKAVCGNEVKVAKAPLLACLTCPLCGHLFQEATTICECLHTFCRECIHSKLSDGETTGCPMCNVNLGCLPLEKLRADHQLDDVKAKLFPDNIRKRKSSAVISPSIHNNVGKRKERSLYSLGIGSVPSNPGFATRKTKWSPTTSADGESSSSSEKSGREAEEPGHEQFGNQVEEHGCLTNKRKLGGEGDPGMLMDDQGTDGISHIEKPDWCWIPSPTFESQQGPGRLYPVHRSLASARNGRKVDQTASVDLEQVRLLSAVETSHPRSKNSTETVPSLLEECGGGAEGEERDFSCPLTTLAEVAGAHAARSTSCQGSKHPAFVCPVVLASTSTEISTELLRVRDSLVDQGKEAGLKGVGSAASSSMNGAVGSAGLIGKRNLTAWPCHKEAVKRTATVKSSSAGFAGPCTISCRRNIGGIWFVLEAAENQMGESVLPQIARRFLRIRDGRLPVSLVKKYLVKKLGLKNDAEVEITCRGQPVVPSLPLESVLNIWFATSSSGAGPPCEGKMKGLTGSGMSQDSCFVRDCLMVLTYQKHRRARFC